jgi:hypothetical protein
MPMLKQWAKFKNPVKKLQVTVTVLESISSASCTCSLIRYHTELEIKLTAMELYSYIT